MTQTYPNPMTYAMVNKITDGTAMTNPAVINPGIATLSSGSPAFEPDTWAEKATNHPLSSPTATNLSPPRTDPDFVLVTLVSKSHNMPY